MAATHPIPPDIRDLPLHLAISQQAHTLWEKYGRPEGRDVAIWLEAERQILGTDGKVNQQPSGAVPAGPLGDAEYGAAPDNGSSSRRPQGKPGK